MLGIDAKAARATWTAAFVLLAILLVYRMRGTLLVFVIALLFAYLVYPLFDYLQSRGGTRIPALALTFVIVLGLIGGLGAFIGSRVGSEAAQLAGQLRQPGVQQQFQNWRVMDIPVGAEITQHYSEIVAKIPALTFQVIAASSNLLDLIIIPILSFFILKDGPELREMILGLFNGRRRAAERLLDDAHTLLLQYMRALLLLCLATLVVFSVVLSAMGVPYGMLLASMAFMLEFIPLVGPLAAAGTILAVSFFDGYPHLLWVALFLGLYRIFQDYVLSPHLMNRGVELHPLAVIFGVFAGGEIGGVAGVFLSIPVIALLRLAFRFLAGRRREPMAES
jgi:predicted PurR-regulated permease PerM